MTHGFANATIKLKLTRAGVEHIVMRLQDCLQKNNSSAQSIALEIIANQHSDGDNELVIQAWVVK